MNPKRHQQRRLTSRREFIRATGQFAAASALAGVALPHVHAADDQTIHLALIGCGGRGSGAVANAMSAGGLVLGDNGGTERAIGSGAGGPVQLVAMADLRQDRLDSTHKSLSQMLGDRVDVPPERRFRGFDAFKRAIDCLRPGDVAMLTTHAAFRAPHLEYAVEKGVNVFMEKDFAADPGGIQRILRAGEAAEKKNLKIAAGLMARHSTARQALIQKIRDGAMGEVQLIRAYRMDSGYTMGPFRRDQNELLWQLSPGHPYQFMWSSGGVFIELMIHQIDECFWIKDAWPVSAHGVGGRYAEAPIAARTSIAMPSSTPSRTARRLKSWAATSLTARRISAPTPTGPSARRSSPGTSTRPPLGSTAISGSIRPRLLGRPPRRPSIRGRRSGTPC